MPIGIFIPADESLPLLTQEFHELSDYQAGVGGLIQSIDLVTTSGSLLIDEEGKYKLSPFNKRATLLLWMHHRAFFRQEELSGDAILIGQATRAGNFSNAPKAMTKQLLEATTFTIEVALSTDPTPWFAVDDESPSWVEAYAKGLSLLTTWEGLVDVRIVAE